MALAWARHAAASRAGRPAGTRRRHERPASRRLGRLAAAATSGNPPDTAVESESEATERRARESARVEERIKSIQSKASLLEALEAAEDKLVVLEVESESVCDLSYPVPESDEKRPLAEVMEPCVQLKDAFQRCMRDCPDVEFLSLIGDMDAEAREVCEAIGVSKFPTIQFWRKSQLLWARAGVDGGARDLSEGLLYYGDRAGGGQAASDWVAEVRTASELEAFVRGGPKDELAIVAFATSDAVSCVRVYPAVLACAKNMEGYVRCARFMLDGAEGGKELAEELDVTQVPSFLFYAGGELVGRYVGASRGDLIGRILEICGVAGTKRPATRRPTLQR